MTTNRNNFFTKEYADNAILQKGFGEIIIENTAKYLLDEYPNCKSSPISIVDLCCGDGGTTYKLLQFLDEQKILVERITGIDISPEQISVAKQYESDPRIRFEVQNVEQLELDQKSDVVISLFGLHWVNDLQTCAEVISKTLKNDGHLIFFVPLEKNDFFNMRVKLMNSKKWREVFDNFSICPFNDSKNSYLDAFARNFKPENEGGLRGDQSVYFDKDQLIKFLSSWMQEVHYLDDRDKSQEYLDDLCQLVQPANQFTDDISAVEIDGKVKYRFLENFFWYHAAKKEEPEKGLSNSLSLCSTVSIIPQQLW